MVIRTWPDVRNTCSHSLFDCLQVRETPESVCVCGVVDLKTANLVRCFVCQIMNDPNTSWSFLTETREHQAKGTVKGFQLGLAPLKFSSLDGKTSYYKTPQFSLSCSKLKGMLLSV